MEAQVLGKLIVDFSQILKANAALTNQLGVHMHDDVIVFRVDDAKPSFLRKNLECLPDITKIDHAAAARRQDIGGEYLQRRVTRLDRLRKLIRKFRRWLGMQHDVICPVAGTFSDEILVTILDGLECRGAVAPISEIDKCSCTAVKRCAADLFGAGRDERCPVGLNPHMMQVYVRVDATWYYDMTRSVDDTLGSFGR